MPGGWITFFPETLGVPRSVCRGFMPASRAGLRGTDSITSIWKDNMDSKIQRELRVVEVYLVVSTVILAAWLIASATNSRKAAKFAEIDVQRINVVEPDGALRMVISDRARSPGAIFHAEEYPHPGRQAAGMLFFNDEGTENGGLIFGGDREKNGTATSYGHLSFDNYDQDQVFTLDASQEGSRKRVGLAMVDRPDWSLADLLNLPENQWQGFLKTHPQAHSRIFLGRDDDESVVLRLKDPQGRDRVVIEVRPDGSPVIQLLDANGKVVSQFPRQPER